MHFSLSGAKKRHIQPERYATGGRKIVQKTANYNLLTLLIKSIDNKICRLKQPSVKRLPLCLMRK
jgi:hypothetical protein